MAGRRIARSAVNWTEFQALMPKEEMASYAAFKAKNAGYERKVANLPEELPKIDWSVYEAKVKIPGMVAEFKKQYEAVKIPYPEDKYSGKVSEYEKKADQIKADYTKESNAKLAGLRAELAEVEKLIPLETMTLQEAAMFIPNEVNFTNMKTDDIREQDVKKEEQK